MLNKILIKIGRRLLYFLREVEKLDLNSTLEEEKNIGHIEIGERTYGMPQIYSDGHSKEKVIIGKYCSIAKNVWFYLGGEHHTDWISTYPFRIMFDMENKYKDGHPFGKGDIVVGNDVWIGMNVKIFSGVHIGDGAVIGANSIVTKNVEPYTIVGGYPAKPIKKRFSDEEIEKLIAMKWWNWEEKKIKDNIDLLCSPNLKNFIDKHTQ